MTAADRHSPPEPAAEDDAVEQRVVEALAATDGRGYDVMARAALDAAGVSALHRDLALTREQWEGANEAERMAVARAEAAEAEIEPLRAERFEAQSTLAWLAPDRTQGGTLSHAVQVVRSTLDEARRQVADLRAQVEALAEQARAEADARFREDVSRADAEGNVVPAPVVGLRIEGSTPDGLGGRTFTTAAPVVPDSTGLRERVRRVIVDAASHESWGGTDIDALTDAVLAVVGQGVTAEQAGPYSGPTMDLIEQGHDMSLAPHYPGPGQWCEACPIPEPAAARSGEQGGEA